MPQQSLRVIYRFFGAAIGIIFGGSGIAGFIWLIFLGEWRNALFAALISFAAIIIAPWIIGGVEFLALLANEKLAVSESLTLEKRIFLLSGICISLLFAIWYSFVIIWMGGMMSDRNWIPLFLTVFGTAASPLLSQNSQVLESDKGVQVFTAFANLGAALAVLTYLYISVDYFAVMIAGFIPTLLGKFVASQVYFPKSNRLS